MNSGRNPEHARSFGAAAGEYERSRPSYPEAAVDWLVPEGARDVLDLGAGTGKLTRLLAARGLATTAVEPLAEMRAVLAAALPEVRALEGSAEEIPLPDASVDAVLVAQAWHWVDEERALPEVARVLRPGGTLGLVWNLRDESREWVRRLTEVMHKSGAELALEGEVTIGPPFGPTEKLDVRWSRPMDLELLVEMVRSRSYVITAPKAERESILAGVRELVQSEPALAGGGGFDLPYVTHCFRARLR
ncbi:MAG TPA: class I SAM-dependent methyltransferase [Solirubrobacterales bacterium]